MRSSPAPMAGGRPDGGGTVRPLVVPGRTRVMLLISSLEHGYEAAERGACTAFNVACVSGGPTHIRRLFALAEAAGLKCFIGTDQESTLGTAAQVHVGVAMPNLGLPCDPMGSVLYTTSPARERIRTEGSYLYPPQGPGLGVELDENKMREMTVASACLAKR